MIKPRLEYENNKPVLKFDINGIPVTMGFSDKVPESNVKKDVLDIITEQYKSKVCGIR